MKRLRSVVVNLGVAAVTLALTASVAEWTARAVVRARSARPQTTAHSTVSRYHPRLGWDKPPSTEAWLHRPEYSVHLVVNGKGLRGPDRPYQKPEGVSRVLLLGDSFVEGYTVAQEQTTAAVLEGLLARPGGPRWEVLNGGTTGWATDQEWLFYWDEGRRYQPDVVVLFFFYNDLYVNTIGEDPFQGSIGDKRKPYFDGEGERLTLRNVPVPPPDDGAMVNLPQPRQSRLKPWRGSMALRLLSDRTVNGNPSLHRFLARWGVVEPRPEEPPSRELWPYGPAHAREVADMWARTAALIEAVRDGVGKDGGRFVVFYVPAVFEVDDRAWALIKDRYGMGPRWNRDRVVDRLAEVCTNLAVPLLDPRQDLRAEDTYFLRDGHWNEAGHRIAAEVVERSLR